MPAPSPSDPRQEERLFISTTPGLEPALDAEVRALGVGLWRVDGGVEVEGPRGLHQRMNLHLRTASRVLLRVAAFPAKDYAELERGLERVDLGPYWTAGSPLDIGAAAHGSKVNHTARIREVAARAFKSAPAPKSEGGDDEEGSLTPYVQLRLERDVCTVSVDTSGELLYRRGYRQEVARAPLRETLAAGMLILAGYRGDEPLWDPMCGSGTLVIEAAWMALRRAPGKDRAFAFQQWPSYDAAAWQAQVAEAVAKERAQPPCALYATDLHSGALGQARRNARRAGVQSWLKLERMDVLSPKPPPEPNGLLITNPPYGIRVGEPGDLQALYSGLGRLLRERLPGWRAAVLVPEPKWERAIGLEPVDAFEIHNGGIRCRLLLFDRQGEKR